MPILYAQPERPRGGQKRKYSGHTTAIQGLALNHNKFYRDKNLLDLPRKPHRGEKMFFFVVVRHYQ